MAVIARNSNLNGPSAITNGVQPFYARQSDSESDSDSEDELAAEEEKKDDEGYPEASSRTSSSHSEGSNKRCDSPTNKPLRCLAKNIFYKAAVSSQQI